MGDPDPHTGKDDPRPPNPWRSYPGAMRRSETIGVVVFAVGALMAALAMARLASPVFPVAPALWFLAMLTGVGFAILLGVLWAGARRRRRIVSRGLAAPDRASSPTGNPAGQ